MKVSWDQVLAWRLRRQFLDPRTDAGAVALETELAHLARAHGRQRLTVR